MKKVFRSVPFIVDVGDSYGQPRPRLRIAIDQDELEYFGVEQSDVYDTIQALFGGVPVGYSHRGEERDPIEIRIGLPKSELDWSSRLASTPVPANTLPGSKTVVELGQVVRAEREVGSPVLFRRDGHFADMVMAELAGTFEAPIYGMLAVNRAIAAARLGQAAETGDQPARPAAWTSRSRRCCGTASGRSPTSPFATWAPRSVSRSSASTFSWSRSSAASSCRW